MDTRIVRIKLLWLYIQLKLLNFVIFVDCLDLNARSDFYK